MSLHEIKINNKSTNKSTIKSTNKTNNKSTINSYKKSFPDLRNILNQNIIKDLTDQESNNKIKVDLKKINKINRPNISSIEVENSKTFRDSPHFNVENIAKNNLNTNKSNKSFSQKHDCKKKSEIKIIDSKDNVSKGDIRTNLKKTILKI